MIDSPAAILVGLLAIFFAGFTQGLTAFGFNLVAVPIMVMILPPTMVVPLAMMYAGLLTLAISVEARRWLDLRRIWPLLVAGTIGVPFGARVLTVLDVNVLKVLIGAVIAAFGVAFLCGFQREIKNEKLAMGPVGLISGVLAGSTGMSGPPVILFLTNQGVGKQVFRANLAVYFTVLSLVAVIAFGREGLITTALLRYAMFLLPAMVVGGFAGIKLAHRVEERLFQRIALIIVTIAGLVAMGSGVRAL
jgi:uncharacterized membrane protein YfcA